MPVFDPTPLEDEREERALELGLHERGLPLGHFLRHDSHVETCAMRRALSCGSLGVECEHGYDVCPSCDRCTCGASA